MLATGLLCCDCPVACVDYGCLASSLWGRQTLVAGPLGSVLPSSMGVGLHCVCVPRAYLLRRSACLISLVCMPCSFFGTEISLSVSSFLSHPDY
jgi:hypothetical protein